MNTLHPPISRLPIPGEKIYAMQVIALVQDVVRNIHDRQIMTVAQVQSALEPLKGSNWEISAEVNFGTGDSMVDIEISVLRRYVGAIERGENPVLLGVKDRLHGMSTAELKRLRDVYSVSGRKEEQKIAETITAILLRDKINHAMDLYHIIVRKKGKGSGGREDPAYRLVQRTHLKSYMEKHNLKVGDLTRSVPLREKITKVLVGV